MPVSSYYFNAKTKRLSQSDNGEFQRIVLCYLCGAFSTKPQHRMIPVVKSFLLWKLLVKTRPESGRVRMWLPGWSLKNAWKEKILIDSLNVFNINSLYFSNCIIQKWWEKDKLAKKVIRRYNFHSCMINLNFCHAIIIVFS